MVELKGLIFNVERFAIHDGPGIRTLVFMKGCPLKCLWCSSPQSQKATPEILYVETNCKKCGCCVKACEVGAIRLSNGEGIKIDRVLCTSCGQCAAVCPNQALEFVGKYMTVEEIFQEVERDSPFYRRSSGGATIGGGEPMMQHEFVAELLRKCKQQNIHAAMETCGYVKSEHLQTILKLLDLVYFDIKHMDRSTHRELTGVSNELILENIRRTADTSPIIIRIPIVPGYNDDDSNILTTATFASKLGGNLIRVELLPYHELGIQTYRRIGRECRITGVKPPSNNRIERLKKIVESCGVWAQIGG